MNKMKIIPLAMLMSLFLSNLTFANQDSKIIFANSKINFASKNTITISSQTKENDNNVIITKKYETTFKDGDPSVFDTRIKIDGVDYEIKTINKGKLIETKTETKDKYIYYSAEVDNKEDLEKIPETVNRNGRTYKLISSDIKEKITENKTKEDEKEVTYNGLEAGDNIPEFTDIVYKTQDDKEETYKLPFAKVIDEKDEWVDTFSFPIEISGYDADYFDLNGVQVDKNAPLINYKDEFLKYLNLSKDFYEIESIDWDGPEYKKNGELCRKAIAKGKKKVKNVKVLYKGEFLVKNVKEYYSENVYMPENEDGTVENDNMNTYVFEESAEYNKVENVVSNSNLENGNKDGIWGRVWNFIKTNPATVALSIGSLAFIGLILSILIFFAKNKKEKDENKVQIIDFDKEKGE